MASQIMGVSIVFSIVYSGVDQIKHQNSASLAFVGGIHRWPVNSPHKRSGTRKMFLIDDTIMRFMPHRGHCRVGIVVVDALVHISRASATTMLTWGYRYDQGCLTVMMILFYFKNVIRMEQNFSFFISSFTQNWFVGGTPDPHREVTLPRR